MLPSSIRWRLAASTTFVVLLCVGLSVAGAAFFVRQSLTDRAHAELNSNLDGVAAYLKTQESTLRGSAQLIASDGAVRHELEANQRQALILHLIPYYSDLDADVLDVVEPSGRVFVRMGNLIASGDNVGAQRNVRLALGGHSVVAVDRDRPLQGGDWQYFLGATMPITLGNGKRAALIVGLQLDTLLATNIGHAVNANINLIAGGRRIGTTLTDAQGLPVTDLPEPKSIVHRIAMGRGGISSVTEDGQQVLSGLAPLRAPTGKPVGAVEVVAQLDPVFALVTQLSLLLVSLGAGAVLLGMALALGVARRLTRRLSSLEASAASIAGSVGSSSLAEGHAEDLVVAGNDEVASLARSVRAMAIALDQRMRATEVQYEDIFQSATDGLVICDLLGAIVAANPAACEMLRYPLGELSGRSLGSLMDASYAPAFDTFAKTTDSGTAFQQEAVGVRRDGSTFNVDVHVTLISFQGQPHLLAVLRDITERVQAYQLLEHRVVERTREISALLQVSQSVASTLELGPVLALLLDGLGLVLDYSGAAVSAVTEGGLRLVDYRGPVIHPPKEVITRILEALSGEDELRTGRPILIGDTHSGTAWAQLFRAKAGDDLDSSFSHVRSFMVVPLMLGDRFTGLLTLAHDQPNHYGEDHVRLATAMAAQAAIAIENAGLYEQAQQAAAHEERARLARELHDSVTQALFSMTMHARAAQMAALGSNLDPKGPVIGNLEQLAQLTQVALAEMRALIFELRPEALREEGLAAALRRYAKALSAREGLAIEIDSPETRIPLSVEVEQQLYALAREALHNAVKHSHSDRVCVRLEVKGSSVRLEVQDWGTGFDAVGLYPGHLGLETMTERARIIGGNLEIISRPGAGTRVTASLPHAAQAVEA